MQFTKRDQHGYVLRLARGDAVMNGLTRFCATQEIAGGWISGLGACNDIELAYYNLAEKKYETKRFAGPLEVVSMTGNIAMVISEEGREEPFIHAHGVFSDREMSTVGGHIVEMIVAVTLEVLITPLESALHRRYDEVVGLKLLDL